MKPNNFSSTPATTPMISPAAAQPMWGAPAMGAPAMGAAANWNSNPFMAQQQMMQQPMGMTQMVRQNNNIKTINIIE